MAKTQSSFTHIVVNGADDDVVIQAGAPSDPQSHAPAARNDARQRPQSAAAPSDGGAEVASSKRKAPEEAYRQTTLEDLQGSSMSTMQKAIIALCVVGVAIAVVYCAFFMS